MFVNKIIELKPAFVGISVLSPYVPIAKRLTKLIRDNSLSLVIWGGIHPTISPDSCIKEADIICVGEGEGAITDLVTHLRDGKEYLNIENLWINNGGHIIRNPMRSLMQDLDSLPFPSYGNDSFYFIDSNRITTKDPTLLDSCLTIQTSRGCPYVCSYCVNSLLRPLFKNLGPYTRRKSVNNIIREIKENLNLSGNARDYVLFVDEVFGTDKSWLDEFESIYKKEIGLPFYVEYNPELINSASAFHILQFVWSSRDAAEHAITYIADMLSPGGPVAFIYTDASQVLGLLRREEWNSKDLFHPLQQKSIHDPRNLSNISQSLK